jgi:hypothetical protein
MHLGDIQKKEEYGGARVYTRAAQAMHIAQCAKMCTAQPARVQRHGPVCSW